MLLVNDELQNNELDTKLKEFKYNINLSEPKKKQWPNPSLLKQQFTMSECGVFFINFYSSSNTESVCLENHKKLSLCHKPSRY